MGKALKHDCIGCPHCCREHQHEHSWQNILRLIGGVVLFAVGILLGEVWQVALPVRLVFLLASYLVLGGDVLWHACRNIVKGRVFDENFLMSLSTLGAFALGEFYEAVAVMLLYQVGESFQARAVQRSRQAITNLMDIRPDTVTVLKNHVPQVVPPQAVAVGDVIMVKAGEKIPLDGVVLTGQSLLDTKALTGESLPSAVQAGDEVFSGCVNQSGVLTLRVTKLYGESTVAQIIELVEHAVQRKAPTENFITKFARYYTPVVVLLAVLVAVIPPLFCHGVWAEWLHRALVFLVVSCPCALVISVPLAFFVGIASSAKQGVLIKGSNYLEALQQLKTVVFDKTGTLTQGNCQVTAVLPATGYNAQQVLSYAVQAERYSQHPLSKCILASCEPTVATTELTDYQEIFGQGVRAVGKQTILVGNAELMQSQGIDYQACQQAGTKVYVAVDGVYVGCLLINDRLRADSQQAITALKQMGVQKTVMLTGDDRQVGQAVAQQLGIDEVHAELLPHAKVAQLERLLSTVQGGKVAYVGDGINDAPVLARADVGIAMGGLGSDATLESADVVLMTDEPIRLVRAIQVAKKTKHIIWQNIIFALAVKVIFMLCGLLGVGNLWLAVFGDVGVTLLTVVNTLRLLRTKKQQ